MRSRSVIHIILSIIVAGFVLGSGCLQEQAPAATWNNLSSPVPSVSPRDLSAPPPSHPTRGDMAAFVDEAVAYARSAGKEKALREFSDRNGSFFRGELYIYAYDANGTTIAHPVNPEKIGVNRLFEKDAKGNFFIWDLREAARKGGDFVEYYYINPVHGGAVEPKTGFVRTVDDTWWLGSGIYGSLNETAAAHQLTTPTREEVVAFVVSARNYSIVSGKEKALSDFNNLNGTFFSGHLYLFAYDYNGTTLVWPFHQDRLGQNRLNATDPSGFPHIRVMAETARKGGGWVRYQTEDPFRDQALVNKTSYVCDIDGTWFIGAGIYEEY